MSRLIFEGNTRERFGRLYPKPFIEEVRAFNEIAEIDIALYFQVDLENNYGGVLNIGNDATRQDIDNFMIFTGIDQLRVHPGFERKQKFDSFNDSNTNRKVSTLLTEYISGGPAGETLDPGAGPETLIQIQPDYSFFYNSKGKKFVKFSFTIEKNYQNFLARRLETILFCITFYKFDEEILSSSPLKNSQYSAISYEPFLNSDGGFVYGTKNVYVDANEVFYGQTPIKDLAGQYKKSLPIGHQQISNIVQQEITPYVGSVAEADVVSYTLQELSDDPNLLMKLKQDVAGFTNKSSATTIGALYLRLVDIISNLDSLIREQEPLTAKRVLNQKIVDQTEGLISLGTVTPIQEAPPFPISKDEYYISSPYGSRQFIPIINPRGLSGDNEKIDKELAVANKSYHFFDFERAINYRSKISEFFNIYNLYQIFNSRGINQFYKISRIVVRKTMVDISSRTSGNPENDTTIRRNVLRMGVDDPETDVNTTSQGVPTNLPDIFRRMTYKKIATGCLASIDDYENLSTTRNPQPTKRVSHIAERAFDTVQGDIQSYRMKFYEVVEYETAIQSGDRPKHQLRIFVNDTTMQFYLHNIYSRIMDAFEKFEEYARLAEQFCSYNNIDGRFNDFFVQAVEEQFNQPFTWLEAPLVYYSFRALLETSYNDFSSFSSSNRRRDGTLINEQALKDIIKVERARVSPISGDLQSVLDFVDKFRELRDIFMKGSSLDNSSGRIFAPSSTDELQLRDPTIVDRFFSEPLGLGAVIGGWDFYDTETLIEDVPSDDPDTGGGQRPGGAPVGGLGSATNFGFADWIISPGREGMSPGYAGEILNFIFSGGGIPGNPSG
jgi:hypothetical protein